MCTHILHISRNAKGEGSPFASSNTDETKKICEFFKVQREERQDYPASRRLISDARFPVYHGTT
jgi:hypothetical protein